MSLIHMKMGILEIYIIENLIVNVMKRFIKILTNLSKKKTDVPMTYAFQIGY